MKKNDIVKLLLPKKKPHLTSPTTAFAPSNIALIKYWGKRDAELNLPFNSSLSLSLGDKGATTTISVHHGDSDLIVINNAIMPTDSAFASRTSSFLDLFRTPEVKYFHIDSHVNIPIAAGLASSACGYAALVKALNQFFNWELDNKALSILARLGSGSASRSIEHGFVEWHAGVKADGLDSYSEALPEEWPEICLALLMISTEEKEMSSRFAMQHTVATSPYYKSWITTATKDLPELKKAIAQYDFFRLGEISESNSEAMHATMLAAAPPINFSQPETYENKILIQKLRRQGLEIFFSQDAGPNLMLIFLEKDLVTVKENIKGLEIIKPFTNHH